MGKLTTFEAAAATLPGAWPRFRGERFDGIAEPGVPLARQWPAAGPEVLWSIELGEGHAGAAVRDGRVFVLDYDRDGLGRRPALLLAGRRPASFGDSAIRWR